MSNMYHDIKSTFDHWLRSSVRYWNMGIIYYFVFSSLFNHIMSQFFSTYFERGYQVFEDVYGQFFLLYYNKDQVRMYWSKRFKTKNIVCLPVSLLWYTLIFVTWIILLLFYNMYACLDIILFWNNCAFLRMVFFLKSMDCNEHYN